MSKYTDEEKEEMQHNVKTHDQMKEWKVPPEILGHNLVHVDVNTVLYHEVYTWIETTIERAENQANIIHKEDITYTLFKLPIGIKYLKLKIIRDRNGFSDKEVYRDAFDYAFEIDIVFSNSTKLSYLYNMKKHEKRKFMEQQKEVSDFIFAFIHIMKTNNLT